MSVMQSMAKGIKPVIHNFVGAKAIYSSKYVWNTIEEAVRIFEDNNYCSIEYLQFIKDNYSSEGKMNSLKDLLLSMSNNIKDIDKDNLKRMPLVTIGITNYNGKRYIKKCVESFLNQTYSNIELLLIDDNSTDGSKEMIQEYEINYSNIKAIYHETNSGGASKGVQEVIENAKGEYFQWIACDDYVQRNEVEIFVKYLEENTDKDYVYCNFNIVDEYDALTGKWNYTILNNEAVIQHVFNTGSGIIPMNCLYRKSFFDKNRVNWVIYKENDFSADTLNTLHFIKYKWNYGMVEESLINYRIHSENASHNIEKRIKASAALYDYIIQNFNEEVYLPQVDWKTVSNREQKKLLCIAQFYYIQLQNHLNMSAIPDYLKFNIAKDQIDKFCTIFAKEGLIYTNKGLLKFDIYRNEFENMKILFEKFLKEIPII
jgi:glycosyltransferase involved in cell wall biosynthesis